MVDNRIVANPVDASKPFEFQYIKFDVLPPERNTQGLGGKLVMDGVRGATQLTVTFDRNHHLPPVGLRRLPVGLRRLPCPVLCR